MHEGERDAQRTPSNIDNIYVRSKCSPELIPLSNLIIITEYADSSSLNRYNRVRAITIEVRPKDGVSLGDGLDYLSALAKE